MSSLTPFAQQTAYESLLSDRVTVLKCMWGTTGSCAIGFRGPYEGITKWVNLFDNHDYQVPTLEQPNPIARSKVYWVQCGQLEGLAYITMMEPRFAATMERFFFCEILRVGEVDIVHTEVDSDPTNEDENGEITVESSYDEARVTELARQYTARFLAEQVVITSFIPAPQQTMVSEYSLGHMPSDPSHGAFETLVEEAAKG